MPPKLCTSPMTRNQQGFREVLVQVELRCCGWWSNSKYPQGPSAGSHCNSARKYQYLLLEWNTTSTAAVLWVFAGGVRRDGEQSEVLNWREREKDNSLLTIYSTARQTQFKRPLLQACLIFITAATQTTSSTQCSLSHNTHMHVCTPMTSVG